MGILVSAQKVVSINFAQENGVNTSLEANPTRGKHQGIHALHVFQRSPWAQRSDDGNPLMHALKGRRGFSILPYWKTALMARTREILQKQPEFFAGHDYCVPIPSASPFCAEFATMVSQTSGVPLIDPSFLRKSLVSEVLDDHDQNPPRIRKGLVRDVANQVIIWGKQDRATIVEVKEVTPISIRPLFKFFRPTGAMPILNPPLHGARAIIIDDVMSSGASLYSVRDVLKGLGVVSVSYVAFMGPLLGGK